jgi:hypothetical protein
VNQPPATAPWERQPGEGTAWYSRFHDHYLLLPATSRSVEAAFRDWRQKVAKGRSRRPPPGWYQAAQRWSWNDRAAAWDAKLQAERLESFAEEIRKLDKKHKDILKLAFGPVVKRLSQVSPEDLTVEQALRWSRDLIMTERILYNQPISVEAHQHQGYDGGPVQTVNGHVVSTHADPDPAYLAEVLNILAQRNALPPEPMPPGDGLDGGDEAAVTA